MTEPQAVPGPVADSPAAPDGGARRRLPAAVRYAIVAILGALVAALASYLLRTVGY